MKHLIATLTLVGLLMSPWPAAAAAAADTAKVQGLGQVLTSAEKRAYRCGWWRGDRPVRAYVKHPSNYRLIPRELLRSKRGVVYRCAFRRPHVVDGLPAPVPAPAVAAQAISPAPPPEPAPEPPPATPVPTVVAPPAPDPATCRYEIGDPTRTPTTSGLRPVNPLDPYAPFADDPEQTDPMTRWNNGAISATDEGRVRVVIAGEPWVHPVASIQFGLAALREYRLTGEQVWFDRAVTSYQEVLATMTDDAMLPQPYPWGGPIGQVLPKPAYSAMTQGQALSLAVRLYETTGVEDWRDLADRLFVTLATPGTENPSVTFIDTDGYLWFEEFPLACPSRVWNGHVWATWGVSDYYELTGNPRALELFDAAATTALRYMPVIRDPGQVAFYNVSHQHKVTLAYHRMMTVQLRYLQEQTGEPEFGQWADLLAADAS